MRSFDSVLFSFVEKKSAQDDSRKKLPQKLILLFLQLFDEIFKARVVGIMRKREVMLLRFHDVLDGILFHVEFEAAVRIQTVGEFEHPRILARGFQFFDIFLFDPCFHRTFSFNILRQLLHEITGIGTEIKIEDFCGEDMGIF